MLRSVSLSKSVGRELNIELSETAMEPSRIEILWRKLMCGCLPLSADASFNQVTDTLLEGLKGMSLNIEISLLRTKRYEVVSQ